MWLLPAALAQDATPDDAWERLQAEHPLLATSLASRDPEARDATAAVLLRADARLVELLVLTTPRGPWPDREGEDRHVDLLDADVWIEGTRLVGTVRGRGVAENGVWLELDTTEGPAPDLELGFGRGWIRARALDGGPTPATLGPVPVVEGDRVSFSFELGDRARPGTVTARLRAPWGTVEDPGPAGILLDAPDAAMDVLVAMAGEVSDPDLAVALAVTFGALRGITADGDAVDADALAWLRYGQGLDAWLEAAGAEWRFADLDALGKLVWAWPGAQAVAYGAVPLHDQAALLDAERYRFVVPDVTTLTTLRDRAPLAAGRAETAIAVDAAINAELRYRASDELMGTLCRIGARPDGDCEGWRADRRAAAHLGLLAGQPVALHDGTSASFQLGVRAREGAWVGDCATATSLAITTLQALGIPAIGLGWSGQDLATPTHDVPLWYDGASFRGTQPGPGRQWAKDVAFVYVTLPAVHPLAAWTLGREPNGWSRGGSVAGGWATYREVERTMREGLPAEVVATWLDVQAQGGWPTW